MKRMLVAACLLLTTNLHGDVTGSLVTPEGKPVAGARVELVAAVPFAHELAHFASGDAAARGPLAVAESDSKGDFKLTIAKRGNYIVRASRTGFAPAAIDTTGAEDLGGLLMRPAEMKKGRVTANGKPVANARVWFAGHGKWLTTTDENGEYSVPDPAVWKPAVHVQHPDYARHVEMMRLHGSIDLTIELTKGVTLRGRVLDPSGKNGVQSSLSVDGIAMGESAEDGRFTLQSVPATWREVVARSGKLVARAERSSLEAMRLAGGLAVSGRVIDTKTGLPLHGATVSLARSYQREVAGAAVVTDEKGAWTIDGLLPGQYQLRTSHAGYGFDTTKVTIDRATVSKDIHLQRQGRFVGRVTGDDDEPVAAALVHASSRSQDRMFLQQNAQVSAADGRYVVRVQPDFLDRELNVEARARGYAITKDGPHTLRPGDEKRVDVRLSHGFALRGRVVDAEGAPLRGITVAADEGGNLFPRPYLIQWDQEPITDADGTFTLRLRPATYDVYFVGAGYAPKKVSGIKIEGTVEPLAITLEPAVSISGRVVTATGEGVPDLRLGAIVDGPPVEVTTDAGGSFALHGLPARTVHVSINGDPGISEFRQIEAPAENVTIELLPTVDISGRVVTVDGAAVSDFTIGIGRPQEGPGFYSSTERDQAFHDPEGKFRLENIVVRPTEIIVTAPGYRRARVRVELAKGKNVDDVEVKLEAGGRVTGRITNASGAALEGARVAIDEGGKVNYQESVTSDASGEYTLEGAPLGEHAVLFSKQGFAPVKKSITVDRSGTRVDAQLSEGLSLQGRVVTDTGTPVADAEVNAWSSAANSGGNQTTTDGNGRFRIAGLSSGIYRLHAAKQGFVEGRADDVDIERAGEVTLTLRQGATIVGRVTGVELGRPDAQVRVGVGAADYSPRWADVQPDGTYRIEGVPAAEVGVVGVVNGRQYRRADMIEITTRSGQTYTVDIEFKEHNTLRGRVTAAGAPIRNGRISFAPRERPDRATAAATIGEDGSYELTGLQSGDYNVSVFSQTMAGPYIVVRSITRSQTLDIDVRPASLIVTIVDDTSGDPIGDADVSLQSIDAASNARPAGKSDAAGRVVIESVSPGDYNVRIAKSGYAAQLSQRSFGEGGRVEYEVRLVPSDGLHLTVLDSRTGKPVTASVTARNGAGVVVFSDRPSARPDGSLLVPLAPGRYTLNLFSAGLGNTYADVTSPGTQQVTMHPGGSIEFALTGTKRVLLLSADGRPYHMDPGDLTAVETVMGGTLYTDVAPGRYTIQVIGPNNAVESTQQVEVVAGQTVKVSL